jgi:hypothetical protein
VSVLDTADAMLDAAVHYGSAVTYTESNLLFLPALSFELLLPICVF